MLSDGGRHADRIRCSYSIKTIQICAFISLLVLIHLQNALARQGECRRDGNNFICERLSLERIPEFNKLPGVESLILTTNQIVELRPNDITRLPPMLKKLDLTDNKLADLNFELLSAKIENLKELVITKNSLKTFFLFNNKNHSELVSLDLSFNLIKNFTAEGDFIKLQKLDLKFNQLTFLPLSSFHFVSNLHHLDLSGNPIHIIPDFCFSSLKTLKVLYLNFMPLLTEVTAQSLSSLAQLKLLEVRNNPLLESINVKDLPSSSKLHHLDLSSSSIKHLVFPSDLGDLSFFDISNNHLGCDCFSLRNLHVLFTNGQKKSKFNLIGFSCTNQNDSYWTLDDAITHLREKCHSSLSSFSKPEIIAKIGQSLLIDCPGLQEAEDVVWLTNRKQAYIHDANQNLTNLLDDNSIYNVSSRFIVMANGSLLIRQIHKKDGGHFLCISDHNFTRNHSFEINSTLPYLAFIVKLDYSPLTDTALRSMMVGAITAAGFFIAATVLGAIRYAFNTCSRKEKRKKKSIREILEKMSGFKAAQMDRFTAYRSAKMDQLLAFKSATMDQLYAFKTARVDKMRKYKQATVTTILHHMDQMREHYSFQSSRIKENCSQQVDKLREKYENGCGRLKDYRSQGVERMRENYSHQVYRIREYGVQQMARLREQYKMQQQYLLKLLELMDVGNCVNVIEAECLKTESVIFDADITFDLEPRPIRMPEAPTNARDDVIGVDDDDDDGGGGGDDEMCAEMMTGVGDDVGDRLDLEDFLKELYQINKVDNGARIAGHRDGNNYGDSEGGGKVVKGGGGKSDNGEVNNRDSKLSLGKKMKKRFKKLKIRNSTSSPDDNSAPPSLSSPSSSSSPPLTLMSSKVQNSTESKIVFVPRSSKVEQIRPTTLRKDRMAPSLGQWDASPVDRSELQDVLGPPSKPPQEGCIVHRADVLCNRLTRDSGSHLVKGDGRLHCVLKVDDDDDDDDYICRVNIVNNNNNICNNDDENACGHHGDVCMHHDAPATTNTKEAIHNHHHNHHHCQHHC